MRRQWLFKEAAGNAGSLFFCTFHLVEPPMRSLALIAISALALAACNKDGQADANRNAGAVLTANDIVANDITAIDAVTADAANMADDINYADALTDLSNDGNLSSATDSNPSGSDRPRARSAPAPRPATPRPGAAETTANSQ
jgi:hypothetical protein